MNPPVVFRHNCLLLLGCGFKCIFRHSQRLLFVKVYIYIFLHYYYIGYYIGFCIIIITVNPEHRKHRVTQNIKTL